MQYVLKVDDTAPCLTVIISTEQRTSLYGGPQLPRQNQKPHGKNKNITAKPKYRTAKPKTSRQKLKPHGKNKIPHGKTKNITAKPKYRTAKPKTSRQKQKPHGKNKYFTAKAK